MDPVQETQPHRDLLDELARLREECAARTQEATALRRQLDNAGALATDADFLAVFRASPDILLLLTPEFRMVDASDARLKATATDREQLVGRDLFEVFPDNPDNADASGKANLRASLQRVLETKRPDEMALQRYDLVRPDGRFEACYWRPLNVPILGPDGEVRFILHRVEDATGEMRLASAETSLRREQAHGQQVQEALAERDLFFDLSLDLLVVAGLDGYFKQINAAVSKLLGWDPHALLAVPFIDYCHPDDVATTLAQAEALMTGKVATLDFENRYRCKDGTYKWLSWRAARQGGLLYAVARDVTEKKAQEAAEARESSAQRTRLVRERQEATRQAKASERRFTTLVENSPDLIARFDRTNRHAFVNATAAKATGLPVEAFLGRTHRELGYPPEVANAMVTAIQRAFDAGEVQVIELAAPLVGGTTYLEVRFNPEFEDGQVVSVIAVGRDMNERKLAAMRNARQLLELRQADLMKDQFLGILSHELRTPINAIMGFTSILDDELAGPLSAEQHGHLAKVLEGAERLLGLVSDLLDMSRIQAGKFSVAPRATRFDDVVNSVLAELALPAAAKQMTLRNRVGSSLPTLWADETRVAQVLGNLVGNALKFTPPGGWVEVSAGVEGKFLRCEVADNGPGIAEADQPKLFEKFSQVDMSATRLVGGVGLGLVICKSLVEAHGGAIGLASQPGQGTTFWFTLPLAGELRV